MKTPFKPTQVSVVRDHADARRLTPWQDATTRIATEFAGARKGSTVRQMLKAAARQLFPAGKALARQGQFVIARNLAGGLPAVPGQAQQAHVQRGRSKLAGLAARPDAQPFAKVAQAALALWREIGPTLIPNGQTYGSGQGSRPSVSGRCSAVTVDLSDSRHIVVCSAGGGLWGSHDLGATWQPLTDAQPTLIMGAIAQAPSAPGVMYAATGDGDGGIPYGLGLLRSSDGGNTWSAAFSPQLQGTGTFDLAVDPTDPLRVWIATDRGLYLSKNGGTSVNRVLPGTFWSVSLHPTSGEVLAAGNTGLQRGDASGNWTAVPLLGFADTLIRLEARHAPNDKGAAYVAACVSEAHPANPDKPRVWAALWRRATATGPLSALNLPSAFDATQGWYDWCLAVSPADPSLIFLGGIDLYRGRYSGGKMTWADVSSKTSGDSIHPDQHCVAFDPSDANVIYACNDGGLFRSPDLGNHWVSLNPGLGITEFEYLAGLESDPDWVLGGTQDNGTLLLAGARRWDQIALGDGGDCAAIDRGAASICYHSYYGIAIESAPAKQAKFSWKDVSPPAPKGYPALFYPPLDAKDSCVAKAGWSVWVSADEGQNWDEVALPTTGKVPADVATAISVVSEKSVVVGMLSGKLWRLDRGSQGWANAKVTPLAALTGAYVSDLCIRTGSQPSLWATCSRVNKPHIFRSTDSGQSFVDRTGNFPDIAANAVVVDPAAPDTVYVGSDRGVFRTTNGGASWSEFNNGLPSVIVGTMLVNGPSRLLRIGTRSRGAWEITI